MALVTFDQLNDFFEDTDEEIIEKFEIGRAHV